MKIGIFVLFLPNIKNDVMKKILFLLTLVLCTGVATAQNNFKGTYYNNDLHLWMKLNLDKKNVPIPGLELDSCYGYIQGNINGSWIILKVKKLDEKEALVRVASERGDVAEDIKLTPNGGKMEMVQVSDSYIKGIANRKYVKLPKTVLFTKD